MNKTFAVTLAKLNFRRGSRLAFYPTVNANPQVLTAAQIEGFNARGYVTPLEIYSPTEIQKIRQYFDDLLTRVVAAGGNSYSISSAHMKYGPVHDIMTNPTIVNYVSDLLGENVIGWGAHFFCKMPGDGKAVAWHQDAAIAADTQQSSDGVVSDRRCRRRQRLHEVHRRQSSSWPYDLSPSDSATITCSIRQSITPSNTAKSLAIHCQPVGLRFTLIYCCMDRT